MTVLYSKTGLT